MSTSSGATFRGDMLAGQVARVVGGSSGIGAAIAAALAGVGAVVTVTGATPSTMSTCSPTCWRSPTRPTVSG